MASGTSPGTKEIHMTLQRRMVVAAIAVTLMAPFAAPAQDLHPSRRPSPLGMARITLGDAYIRIVYGQPYKRGRTNIFGSKESGAVVPYGERWQIGRASCRERG